MKEIRSSLLSRICERVLELICRLIGHRTFTIWESPIGTLEEVLCGRCGATFSFYLPSNFPGGSEEPWDSADERVREEHLKQHYGGVK